MRLALLTTSYPRDDDDVAGAFVRDLVVHLREAGLDVRVVSPADFRHFGVAYGDGIAANLRRDPLRLALVPAFLASYALAARRASGCADLVHAHWLPSGAAALATGRPYVLQAWGTDVELARRAPALFRPVVRRARAVVSPSRAVARDLRELGAREVRVLGTGVEVPLHVPEPEEPAHVLFAGRLSAEKGVEELVRATEGMERVVVGDGPLRGLVPDAVGFVPPSGLGEYYGRAAVVVCPSRREGYGVVARQALAYGRPVVATAVGGLVDAVEDGVNGLLVPPGDPRALRAALARLLGDPDLRGRMGAAGRERARREWSWEACTTATIALYREALGRDVRSRT